MALRPARELVRAEFLRALIAFLALPGEVALLVPMGSALTAVSALDILVGAPGGSRFDHRRMWHHERRAKHNDTHIAPCQFVLVQLLLDSKTGTSW